MEPRKVSQTLTVGADVATMNFSPEGERLAVGTGPVVRIWNIAKNEVIAEFRHPFGVVSKISFAPDGKTVVSTANADPNAKPESPEAQYWGIEVWDASSGRVVFQLPGLAGNGENVHALQGRAVAVLSPDGKHIIGTAPAGRLKTWDATTGGEVANTQIPNVQPTYTRLTDFAYADLSDNGRTLAWLETSRRVIKVYDTFTKEPPRSLKGHTGFISGAMLSPDGTRIISTSTDGTARLWDVVAGQEILRWDLESQTSGQFSPDGQWLSINNRGTVYLMDARADGQ
jgi:WD40 repeat protein